MNRQNSGEEVIHDISRLLECVGLRGADVLIFDIVDGSILRWSRGFKQIENKYCPLVA